MPRVLAIFKRDYLAYFRTPMGYLVFAIFMAVGGLYFSAGILQSYQDLAGEISFLQSFLFVIVPLLTMRSFSEDRKNGTEVLLFTSPASTTEIVLGKYLATLALMLTLLAGSLVHVLITALYGGVVDMSVLGAYIGFVFLASAYLSIGVLASSTTENQLIAAAITFVVILTLTVLDAVAVMLGQMVSSVISRLNAFNWPDTRVDGIGQTVTKALQWLNPNARISNYINGIFEIAPLVYFASIVAACLFLTNRMIEKRRWSQR
jgi:ABC-2 type transport system permease protein